MISKSIRDYIDNNIVDCNNKLELAYTIYILLGKVLYYSPLYVRYKLDNLIPDVDSITLDNPYVNCITWSKLYNEILKEYGINSKIYGDKHKLVEFNIDNYVVRADATLYLPDNIFDVSSDLTNIKFGLDILYFRLVNNEYKEEFNKSINNVNKRFNITSGKDEEILKRINSDNEDTIRFGISFYNYFYKLCDGEVERRQLFERYYPLLFKDIDCESIGFYDFRVLSNHLLIVDDKYYLETENGFIEKSYDEIMDLISNNKISIRYESESKKLLRKTI